METPEPGDGSNDAAAMSAAQEGPFRPRRQKNKVSQVETDGSSTTAVQGSSKR